MESKGKLIVLLVAGLVVAFGAIALYGRIAAPPSELPIEVESNRVIVAMRDMPPGTFVQSMSDVNWQELPPANIKEEYLREGSARLEDYAGAVVRRPLKAGDPITASDLTKAGAGGFMSAVLEPGMRAVSIAVNPTSGNAGFISPGDRVDLIITHRVRGPDSGGGASETVVSETFIHDVRVVAIDQMLDNPENTAILAKTVTVEVTPHQAEQITIAAEMGKISMALRSVAPAEAAATEPTASLENGSVSKWEGGADFSRRVRVFRGNEVENIELQ